MTSSLRIFDRRNLLLVVSVVLSIGFFATTLFGYFVSKSAIRSAIIGQDLPLTASNIYSEIQKDLVRPILISSTMAHDTFLRGWVLHGEKDPDQMTRYLREVRERYGAFSSFFVSEESGNYYTGDGVLKKINPNEPRDVWYYRVRDLKEDYEINVDVDLANHDALTIFINYRVFDFDGKYIGATGIGLTVDAVKRLITDYQARFQRKIFFVNGDGQIVLAGSDVGYQADLRRNPGIGELTDRLLGQAVAEGGAANPLNANRAFQFENGGSAYILNVNYLPELKWYLFIEQNEDLALQGVRQTLFINLVISFFITLLVILVTDLAMRRYQLRLENMASTDKLTGLLNRHAFSILEQKLAADSERENNPVAVLMIDIDHFKQINDCFGHATGDGVLAAVSEILRSRIRASDIAVRWGGEEFLLALPGCDSSEAERLAEKLRAAVEGKHFESNGQSFHVTISVGYDAFFGTGTLENVINKVDAALYRAKAAGRNCIVAAD